MFYVALLSNTCLIVKVLYCFTKQFLNVQNVCICTLYFSSRSSFLLFIIRSCLDLNRVVLKFLLGSTVGLVLVFSGDDGFVSDGIFTKRAGVDGAVSMSSVSVCRRLPNKASKSL